MANQGNALVRARRASYTNAREVVPPVTRGLKSLRYYQGSEADVLRNLAPHGRTRLGIANGTLVGTPTLTGTAMDSVSGVSGVDSGYYETEAFTLIWIGKVAGNLTSAATQVASIGTFNGSSGASIFVINHSISAFPAARVRAQAYDNSNTIATQNVTDSSIYHMYAQRVNVTNVRLRDATDGFDATPVAFDAGRAVAARTIREGTTYTASFAGSLTTAATAIYDVDLTDAELTALYPFFQREMALHSITI